ncbi:uncharacterized protein METZ01_LOCUS474187, partial [marine metagenome]
AFTKNLLSGLGDWMADTDSDGIITVQELGTYLKKKVTIDSGNQQTPKTRNLSTDEGEFVFVLDGLSNNNNNSVLESPINANNTQAIENMDKNTTNLAYVSIGSITSKQLGIKTQIGYFRDKGNNEIGFTSAFAEATNLNIDLIQPIGIYYRRYLTPFGKVFFNIGLDMTVFHVKVFADENINWGFKPYIGLGGIGGKIFDKQIYWNFDMGYVYVSESFIPDIEIEDIPHGIQFDLTFGIHRRYFS